MSPNHSSTQYLVNALADSRPRLNDIERKRADSLIANARLFGTGYSQRAMMRELIAKAEASRPKLAIVA